METIGARKVMQSALDQWVEIERIMETAEEVLSEEEATALRATATRGATRALAALDEQLQRRNTPASAPGRRVVISPDSVPPYGNESEESHSLRRMLSNCAKK